MIEEPYRWLEAIANRREYIRDQLKGGTPVFAISREEGVLLLGVGQGQTKVFEVYDRHAIAGLGHPVDLEKLRQSAIEAAHMEGFNRSPQDVTLRRLINFALSPSLKNSFEQIFSPPLMVESIFAELGDTPGQDVLARVHYDGNHAFQHGGVVVAHTDSDREREAREWIERQLRSNYSLGRVAECLLQAWTGLVENQSFSDLKLSDKPLRQIPGRVVEAGLLDRKVHGPAHYRVLDLHQI